MNDTPYIPPSPPSPIEYSLQEGGLFTPQYGSDRVTPHILELANKRWFFSYTAKCHTGGNRIFHNGLIQGTHPLTFIDLVNQYAGLKFNKDGVLHDAILIAYNEIEAFHFDIHTKKVVDAAKLKQMIKELKVDEILYQDTTWKEIIQKMDDHNTEAGVLEGLDEAIIGIKIIDNSHVFVYSRKKIIDMLITEGEMEREVAIENCNFNIERAIPYMGKHAPFILIDDVEGDDE